MIIRELEYPFDINYIMSHKRKIKKQLVNSGESFINKNIAVLGGSTTSTIVQILELFLLNYGIRPVFYESEYGKYYEDAVFGNKKLEEFKPDLVYIYTTNRNLLEIPQVTDTQDHIREILSRQFERFEMVWSAIEQKYDCPIIQNNMELPYYRILGNMDASDVHGVVNYVSRFNMMLYEYTQTHKNVYICDINYISADFGLKEWSDPFYWYMYKYALNMKAIPYLAHNVAKIIKAIYGKNKKGFVLDLDNTLWGGVIGDDGVDNIKIGPEESSGQVFSEFQKYIKEHLQMGIVLNIDSKNDEENAVKGLEHAYSILRPDDFVVIKANWKSKDENFKEISSKLNLLPESLVFIDDNPAERHIITQQIKGVSAPEIGESHEYIMNIDRNGYFESIGISEDDTKRNQMYKENEMRTRLQSSYQNYGDYLDSLGMEAVIRPFEPPYIERIAQLSNKSNQFNLTTKRYTSEEIERLAKDGAYVTAYGKLRDRFGDNGVVAVCIGRIVGKICHIDLWLMSCRVLKREMEYAMFDVFVDMCLEREISMIYGYYYPTAKNHMVEGFYNDIGFELDKKNEAGSVWVLKLGDGYYKKNYHIKVGGMK